MEELGIANKKVLPYKFSAIPPWKLPSLDYCDILFSNKRELSDIIIRNEFLMHMEEHKGFSFVFTDGSKSDAGVGFGVISETFNRYGCLPPYASIFTAELFAILTAVKQILSLDKNDFVIFSDSQSALQALQVFNSVNPIVMEILEWIILAKRRGKIIKFCWVPAHVGIEGNERADELAKFAAITLTPRNCLLPCSDCSSTIKPAAVQSWNFVWELLEQNKMKEIALNLHPWSYNDMSRRKETALCRLRIGHSRLTHGFLMSRDFPPFCEDCLVPQTIRHLLIECPSLEETRQKFLSNCKDQEGNYVLEKVIGKNFNEINLFNFIKEIGILFEL